MKSLYAVLTKSLKTGSSYYSACVFTWWNPFVRFPPQSTVGRSAIFLCYWRVDDRVTIRRRKVASTHIRFQNYANVIIRRRPCASPIRFRAPQPLRAAVENTCAGAVSISTSVKTSKGYFRRLRHIFSCCCWTSSCPICLVAGKPCCLFCVFQFEPLAA